MPVPGWLNGRQLRFVGFSVFISLISLSAFAQDEPAVFDVRKPIALSESEDAKRDYYINGGVEVGLKPGTIVNVTRRKSLYDAYQNKSPGDLVIPVGQLKIIFSQRGLSVARLHSLYSRNTLPVLDYDYIMIGDRLDLSSATMEKKKSAHRSPPQKTIKEAKAVSQNTESKADFSSLSEQPGPAVDIPNRQ